MATDNRDSRQCGIATEERELMVEDTSKQGSSRFVGRALGDDSRRDCESRGNKGQPRGPKTS